MIGQHRDADEYGNFTRLDRIRKGAAIAFEGARLTYSVRINQNTVSIALPNTERENMVCV